jgi:hypothetical protein
LAPHAIQGAFKSVHTHVSALHDAVSPFDFGAMLYHGLSLMLLTLSVAGVGILLIRIGRTVPRKLARRQARRSSPQSRHTHTGG